MRSSVREAFFERARISVKPTKTGLKEIDEAHDCFAVKYLTDKPVSDLSGDTWLKLIEAEKLKLVEIEFAKEISSYSKGKSYLQAAQDLYKFDAYSKIVQEWNKFRAECVEIAFTKILYPMLRKELRYKLMRESKDSVIQACRSTLYDWLKVSLLFLCTILLWLEYSLD